MPHELRTARALSARILHSMRRSGNLPGMSICKAPYGESYGPCLLFHLFVSRQNDPLISCRTPICTSRCSIPLNRTTLRHPERPIKLLWLNGAPCTCRWSMLLNPTGPRQPFSKKPPNPSRNHVDRSLARKHRNRNRQYRPDMTMRKCVDFAQRVWARFLENCSAEYSMREGSNRRNDGCGNG